MTWEAFGAFVAIVGAGVLFVVWVAVKVAGK